MAEVASECTRHMIASEGLYQPSTECIGREKQPELKKEMRKTLVSWLVEVCTYFKLSVETWYIAVNIVDRFSDKYPVGIDKYQLLGVTAVLIASKYEEISPPTVNDLVDISAETYQRD